MITQSDCGLDCACHGDQQWQMMDLVAMEPQQDGSVLVTLERTPMEHDGMLVQPGVRYQLRMRRSSLMVRAKVALLDDDELVINSRPGLPRPGLRRVLAEVTVRGAAMKSSESGIYMTMQVLPEPSGGS